MSVKVQRAAVNVDSSTHIHITGKGNIAAFNNISSDFQTIRQASVLYKTYTIVPCVVCKLSRRSYFNVCAVCNQSVSIIQFSNYINLSCNIYAVLRCVLNFEIVYSGIIPVVIRNAYCLLGCTIQHSGVGSGSEEVVIISAILNEISTNFKRTSRQNSIVRSV